MGCVGSDVEDELRTNICTPSKRFKFSKKFFDDCNTVYHASVPRKLRSAIKKRSCESISRRLPVSKKLNYVTDGVELFRKDGLMKSNLNMKQGKAECSSKDGSLGRISKDEEEVAEALYALAGILPNTANVDKNKLDGEQSVVKSSALPKAQSSLTTVAESVFPKAEAVPKPILHEDAEPIHSSNIVGSAAEVVILHSRNESRQPDISISKKLPMELEYDIPEVNLPLTAIISENEQSIQRPMSEPGSKFPKPEKSLESCNYSEIALTVTGAAYSQTELLCDLNGNRDTGLLSRTFQSEVQGIPLRLHTAKLPGWFESSSCIAQSAAPRNSVIAKKDAQVIVDSKKPWKRCSTHVYITRFIKDLQTTERKDRLPLQSTQSTNEGLMQVAHKIGNGLIGARSRLIGIISTSSTGCPAPEKNATEVRNAILLHKRLVQDQQQAPITSSIYPKQKQSLDFLSLPTGSCVETSNGSNRAGQSLDALTPLHFSSRQPHYQPVIPYPLPHKYFSTSLSGHPSAAAVQQIQLPTYVGRTPYGPPPMGTVTSAPELEQQQQQKRSPPSMAHYNSGVASPSIPNWQTGAPDLSPMFRHTQILFPPSCSSIEGAGTKYAPILQQQQQSISATAILPPSMVKGRYHHLPSVYEGNVGGIHSDMYLCG